MIRKTHNLVQGSPEWLHFRSQHFGASEAGAMLGLSPKKSRAELLREKHTALSKEFSSYVQERVLDEGHRVEALARPILEQRLGMELFPATMSFGRLSASCDGLTMMGDVAMEHKNHNEPMARFIEQTGQVPPEHMPQCQQVLLVTGAERLIFVMSDGTPDRFLQVEVLPDAEWFERITAGWALFEQDLATYVPPVEALPAPVGKAPEDLPAVLVELRGEVVASNLAAVKELAIGVFKGINRELASDQDFADAERTVKWCEDIEARLKAAKDHALAQASSIEEVFRSIDEIVDAARVARLDLTKLVDARKKAIREDIVAKARQALDTHAVAASRRAGRALPGVPVPDWAAAIKGKRTVATLQAAVDGVLTAARLEIDAIAERVIANVASLTGEAHDWTFLFPDLGAVCGKPIEDFANLLTARIAAHEKAERERREREAAAEAAQAAQAARVVEQPTLATQQDLLATPVATAAQTFVPTETARQHGEAEEVTDEKATIKLGEINDALGFTMTAAFVESLGIAAQGDGRAKLYRPSDFALIKQKLIARIQRAEICTF